MMTRDRAISARVHLVVVCRADPEIISVARKRCLLIMCVRENLLPRLHMVYGVVLTISDDY